MTASRAKCVLSVQNVTDGGGSERALIASITQLRAEGWECHVALGGPAALAEEYHRAGAITHLVPMHRLTTSGGPERWVVFAATWPLSVLRLARLARRVDASVIHSNSLHCWYGWAAAALLGRPHVWHAREIVAQSAAALGVERFLAKRFASRVVAVSTPVAEQLDPANVVVILDRADPERFKPSFAGRFRQGAEIADEVPLVGSVARIDTWKGFEVLLDAVPSMQAARPELQLVVAGAPVGGKDQYAADLARRAAEMPGVHWLGHRRDIPELMADLDVFVQVSTLPEPFGLVLVEALASGVPVVAGDQGGPVEILAGLDPGAGILVKSGDAVALASAVVVLLPGSTSTASRAARPARITASSSQLPRLLDEVVAEAQAAKSR